MSRSRIQLTPEAEAELRARAARGESGETIAAAMGKPVSARTLRRRKAELRGKAPAQSSPVDDVVAPADVPISDDLPIEQINAWIRRLETAARKAEEQGNLQALASIAAKVQQLMALRHRAAPIPKPNPNERPDYIALAKQFEEKFLKLVQGVFEAPNADS